MARIWNNEQLIEAVASSSNYQEVAKKLGLSNYGANSRTIQKYVEILAIDTSHFLSVGKQAKATKEKNTSMTLEEMLVENSTLDRKYLKRRLLEHNLLPYECNNCKITEWDNKPISLHLDHVNGVNNDHRLENLRLLCPNCHSQTDTYCGRQLKKPIQDVRCLDCGVDIGPISTRCRNCAAKKAHANRKIQYPPLHELVAMVRNYGTEGTGRKFGVSGNAIEKRIQRLRILQENGGAEGIRIPIV